jgi:Tol biopolymer transport system component
VPSPSAGPVRNGLIAFDDGKDLRLVDPEGSHARRVKVGDMWELAPAWSPDGTRLAYWSGGGGRYGLMVLDWPPSGPGASTEVTWSVTDDSPAWSPDGRWLAFDGLLTRAAPHQVGVVATTGGERTDSVGSGYQPTWSPDGSMIAYYGSLGEVSEGNGPVGTVGLVLEQMDRSDPRLLTDLPTSGGFVPGAGPAWSRDGTRIAFEAGSHIWIVDVDGSDLRDLTPVAAESYAAPAWSPDGARLAYLRRVGTDFQLVIALADGSGPVELATEPLMAAQPVWSPDGSRILAFTPSEADAARPDALVVIDPDEPDQPARSRIRVGAGGVGVAAWQALPPE